MSAARTLEEVIGSLPADQQVEIAAGAVQLIKEEMTLRNLRTLGGARQP